MFGILCDDITLEESKNERWKKYESIGERLGMLDNESKDIIDTQGKPLKIKKCNAIKEYLKTNIWNILGTGFAAFFTVASLVNVVISREYSKSCANFYGIDRKYFSGTGGLFEDKAIFVICALILFVYPLVFSYIVKKTKNKLYMVLLSLATICVLGIQNIAYTPELNIRAENVIIVILFVSDLLITYFLIVRVFSKKKYNKVENVIFTATFLIYAINVIVGIAIRINYDISDKKTYEVIENNRAVVSTYDGKFVVMDCKIQGETIILTKGTYRIEDMTDVTITYHNYDKVICE